MTSLGSTNDETHTFPSMEEVAMYIEFEGVAGTVACWLLGCPRRLAELEEDLLGSWSSVKVEALVNGSGFKVGKGGGNGETEIDVILAEWAWYTRRDCRRGKDSTCYGGSAIGSYWVGVHDLQCCHYAFRSPRLLFSIPTQFEASRKSYHLVSCGDERACCIAIPVY